jgi:hypothetical protein
MVDHKECIGRIDPWVPDDAHIIERDRRSPHPSLGWGSDGGQPRIIVMRIIVFVRGLGGRLTSVTKSWKSVAPTSSAKHEP